MHDIRMVRDAADALRDGMRRRGKLDALGPLVERAVALDEPVAAITPGQSLVLYDGTRVLGGGFIA